MPSIAALFGLVFGELNRITALDALRLGIQSELQHLNTAAHLNIEDLIFSSSSTTSDLQLIDLDIDINLLKSV